MYPDTIDTTAGRLAAVVQETLDVWALSPDEPVIIVSGDSSDRLTTVTTAERGHEEAQRRLAAWSRSHQTVLRMAWDRLTPEPNRWPGVAPAPGNVFWGP